MNFVCLPICPIVPLSVRPPARIQTLLNILGLPCNIVCYLKVLKMFVMKMKCDAFLVRFQGRTKELRCIIVRMGNLLLGILLMLKYFKRNVKNKKSLKSTTINILRSIKHVEFIVQLQGMSNYLSPQRCEPSSDDIDSDETI